MTRAANILDAHVTVGQTPFGSIDPATLISRMDWYGISQAVIAPRDRWLAVDNREGNDTILEWIRSWPDRFLGYATVNPWFGERAIQEMERALTAGLCGMKLHPARQGFVLLEPLVEPLLELAAQRAVPVYVVTGVAIAAMPFQLAELARRHPSVNFIMGRSGRTDYGWLDMSAAVRQAPNIYVETAHNLPGTLEQVLEITGPDRIIFASDTPLTNLKLELAKIEKMSITPATRTAILHTNLARLLGSHERQGQHAND
jgi:uncharacterized protein